MWSFGWQFSPEAYYIDFKGFLPKIKKKDLFFISPNDYRDGNY